MPKYLLIGGGLAASRAAHQIRDRDPDGSITLVTDEPYAPYDRPPLSKEFLRGKMPRAKLAYDSPADLRQRGIELKLGSRIISLDPARHEAQLSDGSAIQFEKALMATGGRPVRLDFEGVHSAGIHYLRTVDDAEALARAVGAGSRIVVIGAGFIGIEAAASLTQLGCHVTVVEAAARVWARFADHTLSEFLERYCADRGVTFHTSDTVTEVRGNGRVRGVLTRTGRELECDALLVAVGIAPNVELAADAGLEVEDGIVVDSHLRTSHPDIYAAGDVVSYPDPVLHKRRRVEHWGHAEYGGQIAGQNMTGADRMYNLLSYVWSDVFDLHVEFAGDETDHERALVRGDVHGGAFTVLYLRAGALSAYFSVNGSPREFAVLKKLIRRGVRLIGREDRLTDPGVALQNLL